MSKSLNKQSVEAEELEKSYQLPDIVQQRQHTLKKIVCEVWREFWTCCSWFSLT